MRRRSWAALGLLATGVALAIVADAAGSRAIRMAAGGCILAGGALALSLLPVWRRLAPPRPDLRPLFPAVGPRSRWCVHCGKVAPRTGTCPSCGRGPPARRALFHRKPLPKPQERK